MGNVSFDLYKHFPVPIKIIHVVLVLLCAQTESGVRIEIPKPVWHTRKFMGVTLSNPPFFKSVYAQAHTKSEFGRGIAPSPLVYPLAMNSDVFSFCWVFALPDKNLVMIKEFWYRIQIRSMKIHRGRCLCKTFYLLKRGPYGWILMNTPRCQ